MSGKHPVFRKTIVPWYDSDKACILAMLFLVCTLLFGMIGFSVAMDYPSYHSAAWLPLVVIVFSIGVIASISVRMLKRHTRRK